MRAVVIHARHDLRIDEVPPAQAPGPGEVRVAWPPSSSTAAGSTSARFDAGLSVGAGAEAFAHASDKARAAKVQLRFPGA